MNILSFLVLAAVELAAPFSDHMVVQRRMKVPVWGRADPGERIRVSFAGQSVEAVADAEGRWRANLPSMEACAEGRSLSVNDVEVRDVLVGEVWLCAGQSNMGVEFCCTLPHCRDKQGAMLAQTLRKPQLRFASTAADKYDSRPWERPLKPIEWKAFTPENLRPPSFSAVAVYFALSVHDATGLPIGLVGVYRGATGIDSWTPCDGIPERTKDRDDCQPGVYWNTVVNPWVPFAARGMIWYQGEHDAGEPDAYAGKLRRLYDGWRTRFANPDLRFYYAQLCSWGGNIAPMQEAQARFEREEPNAAMAVTTDVCNLTDIHPNDKEPVGRRLALHAIRRDYGREFGLEDIQDNSPSFAGLTVTGAVASVSVRDARGLYIYNRDFSTSNGFEIAGADGIWRKARILNLKDGRDPGAKEPRYFGQLIGTNILLSAEGVEKPIRVRYLHSRPWTGNLYNEVDLPMGPFHAECEPSRIPND